MAQLVVHQAKARQAGECCLVLDERQACRCVAALAEEHRRCTCAGGPEGGGNDDAPSHHAEATRSQSPTAKKGKARADGGGSRES
ncbi:MAG: hypothetical protein IPI43_25445 [Sandaracinaceae bacterium]|nr:hypothetical protein [Sandaracinaceae bacterium]